MDDKDEVLITHVQNISKALASIDGSLKKIATALSGMDNSAISESVKSIATKMAKR